MRMPFFSVDGVTLLGIIASIHGAGAQPGPVPAAVVIKLERAACGGDCPVYTVTIDGKGNVIYDGTEFVRVAGRQTDRIPVARVAAILETAERIAFFDLRDQYRYIQNPDGTETIVTDLPTAFVTITREGRSKRIEDNLGAPEGLKQLERQIDEAARTKRWILLDEQMLEQLTREGWTPSSEERAELLRKAVEQDEVALIKGLLDLGTDPNVTYFGTNTPPLMMVRSAAAARVLLAAGAHPFAKNDFLGTPLAWSAHLAPEVAELLLNAGAHVDDPADEDGRTALWSAACNGNAGVVTVLLAAGANPAASVDGRSALNCAKTAREGERLRPSVLDRKPPFVVDFDRVITLLEQALANRRRR